MRRPRVGIFSGAFDPVHNGHIAFALEACHAARLDKVFFLVEPHPRHKQGVKALEHRLNMVRLAIDDYAQLGVIVLDHNRFNIHETWPQIEARFADAEIVMLLGDDVFWRLSRWPEIESLVQSTSFAVGVRRRTTEELRHHMQIVEDTRHIKIRYSVFQAAHNNVSSSQIRHALKSNQLSHALHPRVLDYIRQTHLYVEESNA